MQNNKKSLVFYSIIIFIIFSGLYMMTTLLSTSSTGLKYSDVIYMFEDELVKDYSLDLGSGVLTISIDTSNPDYVNITDIDKYTKTPEGEILVTYQLASAQLFVDDVDEYITEYNIKQVDSSQRMGQDFIPAKDTSWIMPSITMLILVGVLVFLFFTMMRQAGGGSKMNQFTRAATKPVTSGKKTTFAEVAGADEEKEELNEIVQFLKDPKKFNELGARIPKGVLLLGPPGTGKTLLARAVAGEAGVPFYSISGSDFVEMYVGVGASRVRELFSTAKKAAPAIVFIDEIDAVGRHRGAGLGGGHDEREQTLNQLLVEMDGFGENSGVIVVAATNRRDILDPALLRPGRFDRQVIVAYPDVKGREEILKVHSKNKPLGFDVNLQTVARATVGFTGADLENLLNEAALLAARNNRKAIIATDIEDAVIKVVAGPEKKSHKVNELDKKITAYHEAGHAVVSYYCETQDKVHEISIIPRGMAAGYTMNLPDKDLVHVSKRKMKENIIVLLAGRVAEHLTLEDVCTGASNDIERATAVARDMVTKFGFSDKLGTIAYGQRQGEVFLGRDLNHNRDYSEDVATKIDSEIRQIIEESYNKSTELLKEHFEQLELIAKWLLRYEKIDASTFQKLMKGELTEADIEDVTEEKTSDADKDATENRTEQSQGETATENSSEQSQDETVTENSAEQSQGETATENSAEQSRDETATEEDTNKPTE